MATDLPESDAAEARLEAALSAARVLPDVPGALLDRILRDAAAETGVVLAPAIPDSVRHDGVFARLAAVLGGWPAMSGMAAAAATGVLIGFSSPAWVEARGLYGSDYTIGDLMPSAILVAEGTGSE